MTNAMENWRVELTAKDQAQEVVKIQRSIFQGDLYSSLLVVIALMPLNYLLRKCTGSYKFTILQEKIN